MSRELLAHRAISAKGCWLWTGMRTADGYGLLKDGFGNLRLVHVEAFKQAKGKIPKGKEVMHVCPFGPKRACFNPGHLKAGTHKENCKVRVSRRST